QCGAVYADQACRARERDQACHAVLLGKLTMPVRGEPFDKLRTGLSNHGRTAINITAFPFASFDWLRTGFDKLRANGDLIRTLFGETRARPFQ
ncbi:MAG: hypothetical protein ABR553_11420, partial [Gammaproteobacteria bacterium]